MADPSALPCPNCGAGLRFVEEYGRQYCDACGQYAPEGYGGGGGLSCPRCGGVLSYIKDYNRYFCYKDQEYPTIETSRESKASPVEPEPEIPWIDDLLSPESETQPPPQTQAAPETPPPDDVTETPSEPAPTPADLQPISPEPSVPPVATEGAAIEPVRVEEPPKQVEQKPEPVTEPTSPPVGASAISQPVPQQVPSVEARPLRTSSIAKPPLVREEILRAKKSALMDLASAYGLDSMGPKETLRERLFAELVRIEKEEERRLKEERETAAAPMQTPEEAAGAGAADMPAPGPEAALPSTPADASPRLDPLTPNALPEEAARAATPAPAEAAMPAFIEAPPTPVLPAGEEAETPTLGTPAFVPDVVPAPPKVINPCPTCGRELTYIEEYDRYYCYNCKAYAPPVVKVEAVPAPPRIGKPCPTCGRELTYIPEYNRHYCYNCKRYAPLEGQGGPAPRPAPAIEMIPPKPEPAPAPPPAVELVAVKNPCPTCGRQLSYIEKYGRYYCYSCRKYAPQKVKNPCPNCGKELTYIPQYSRHHCPSCGQYAPREMTARILAARASGVATSPAVFASGATATRTVAIPVHRHVGSPTGAIGLSATGLIVLLTYEFLWAMPQAFGAGPSYLGLDPVTAPAVGFIVQLIGFLMIGLGVIVGLFLLRTRKG